ncbi:hypothetical protein [Paraburkholderia humisilvae]|uniref:Uncharacterized protein n=1 Tax=Paraburkholderia humisilvae TaxID=627669 RepID=A0A6J5DJ34_9BURK|nr:hypothetical protein [Paraburkholderia humisilvae]CAB3753943.1 hypothetical protein LMG29542_02197 [Paraburkholderia humisilvae]
MKRLADGERREIKASRNWSMLKNRHFKVEAERIDSDTPCIHVTLGDCTAALTDVEALDLIERLQTAISVLPTSK